MSFWNSELEEGMERLRTELSRERELREAAEHIQQQLRDEKNSLQSVLQQKDGKEDIVN